MSAWPASSNRPAIGAPMFPTPMNPIFNSGLQRVKTQRVVPEALLFTPVAQRQREETVHRLRILRIAVRVVGRRDEVVVAERIDDMRDELLVALDGAETLPAEI